jgi:hypothetical protein
MIISRDVEVRLVSGLVICELLFSQNVRGNGTSQEAWAITQSHDGRLRLGGGCDQAESGLQLDCSP